MKNEPLLSGVVKDDALGAAKGATLSPIRIRFFRLMIWSVSRKIAGQRAYRSGRSQPPPETSKSRNHLVAMAHLARGSRGAHISHQDGRNGGSRARLMRKFKRSRIGSSCLCARDAASLAFEGCNLPQRRDSSSVTAPAFHSVTAEHIPRAVELVASGFEK